MRFRKLRIAWSVFGGIAAVLLVVLWVRSYWKWDAVCIASRVTAFGSNSGTVYWIRSTTPFYVDDPDGWWNYNYGDATEPAKVFVWQSSFTGAGSGTFALPFWLPVLLVILMSAAPWLRLQFSLRTMLIATTLVAVVLGTITWLARQ